jgi:hypothetical protein
MTTPPPGPPSREGWRRHARAIVAERLGLKLTAVVVSVLLWFVVHVVLVAGGAP